MIRFLQPMVQVLASVLKGNRLGAAPSRSITVRTYPVCMNDLPRLCQKRLP